MYKIRIHGRGGQGAKTAAQIIGYSAFLTGKETQDFSMYGAERRGAPVTSYVRISPTKIYERGHIHDPDCVIVLDSTLLELDLFKDVPNALKIINSKKQINDAVCIDATSIALNVLKENITNTAMLGAFSALNPVLNLRDIIIGSEKVFGKKNKKFINSNIVAIQKGYEAVKND